MGGWGDDDVHTHTDRKIMIPQKCKLDVKAQLKNETDIINSTSEGNQWNF
jgi:hypothetical protein